MAGQAGPKKKKCTKKVHRDNKTRHYIKDVDQIHEELAQEQTIGAKRKREIDPDLPGLGQFYCAETDRHFISQEALDTHKRTKTYKKRCKVLRETPYSKLEAELASGKGMPDKGYS
jgi:bud site selection protein 20